ncbi:MAG: tetratricopeptide repeat protein [Planctomycetota bacterium]|nr:tetratricopeptide repeat protein [Planctomycetota bacterium]
MPRPIWIVLLALAAWMPGAVRGGTVMDDRELLFANPVVDGSLPLSAAFDRDYFHHVGDAGQWRPLATLSLRLERALWGEWTHGYHLGNVLLHALVCALAAALLRRRPGGGSAWPWFGLALFAVHPALADAVAWISGRTAMVSAAAGLAGALACGWAGRRMAGSSAAGAAALVALAAGAGVCLAAMGKEDGVCFALLYVLAAPHRRAAHAAALGATAGLAVYLTARGLALGHFLPAAAHPVLGAAPLAERLVVGGCELLEGLRLAVLPADYPPLYRAEFLLARFAPLGSTTAAGAGWLLWATLVAAGAARRRTLAGAAALLAACAWLPVLQLAPLGEVFAPRFLYLPLLFGAPLADALLARLPGRAWIAAAALVAASVAATQRSVLYADRAAWREEMLRHHPDDAPSWNALGLVREERGDLAGARAAWRRATEADPRYSRPWSNLGRALLAEGELGEAERLLRRALAEGPRNPVVRVNLGSCLLRAGRAEEALAHYERARELAAGLAAAWRGEGQALSFLGRHEAAARALRRALALDPRDDGPRRLLAGAEAAARR